MDSIDQTIFCKIVETWNSDQNPTKSISSMLSCVSKVSRIGLSVARASSTARVWIDKNTKVIGQGITGKNVGIVFVFV